ncbi:transporter substrate-binding domain-containing protein [Bacteriovoracales bacterium]|nr:transporter substrate-binding domain-containing protein [Bacteriovoracales bacterium]
MLKTLLGLLLIFSLSGTKADLIKMTTVSWPPFFGKSLENGGFLTALTKEVLKTQGHKLEVTFQPWARALKEAKRASYHALLGCWRTNDREKDFLFSKTNVNAGMHFLSLPQSKYNIKKIEDLNGLTIGRIRGYGMGQKFKEALSKKKFSSLIYSDDSQALRLLKKKKVDVIMENYSAMKYKIGRKFPSQKFNLKLLVMIL